MTLRKFADKVQCKVMETLGEQYDVKLQEVQKNNNVRLLGLIILTKGQNVSPTIYLDDFYEAYCNGCTMERVVEGILHIYEKDAPKRNIDMSFFKDFSKVKDRICFRLINAKKNQALLEQIPYVSFLDLAICFYYSYHNDRLGDGSILIYNTHIEMWETSIDELLNLAMENTPQLYPWNLNSMDMVINELLQEQYVKTGEVFMEEEEQKQFFKEVPMKVLSNKQKVHGASCILYKGVMEEIAAKMQGNFYILPSSIHELIFLADTGTESSKELKKMIAEVNETQVEAQEILSNSLYYYSQEKKTIQKI